MSFCINHHNLSYTQKEKIVKDLILKEKNCKYGKPKELKVFYINDNYIYIPMYYATKMFKNPIINIQRNFHRIKPFNINVKLRTDQDEVVDKSLENYRKSGCNILNLFCSFGKTVIGAYFSALFSQQYNLMTLVVVPNIFIINSWANTYKEFTDANVKTFCGEEIGSDVQVVICINKRLKDLNIKDKIGHLILDEAHCMCTQKIIDQILQIQPLFITILTATFERNDGFETALNLIAGHNKIVKISTKKFYVFRFKTNFTVDADIVNGRIDYSLLVKKYDNIEARNLLIVQLILNNLNEKILVLTKHKEHVDILEKLILQYIPYKTVVKLSGAFKNYNDSNIIIGSISKIGLGFDEKTVCLNWLGVRINMLILASSTMKIEQLAGRVFRSDCPVIIDIVDNNFIMRKHWYVRKKWYLSRNGIIIDIKESFCWSDFKCHLKDA